MRKFIDPNPTIVDASMKQYIPWPFFRYTEAVFNYIEASIELNQLSNAILWLNRIRFRSGMPAITETSQAALRARYRHERRSTEARRVGKECVIRVDLGGSRNIKKKNE